MTKAALLGASSLAGRELAERLKARGVPASSLALVEPGSDAAVISAVEDELLLSTPRLEDALDGATLALACVPLGEDDARLVRDAAARGLVALDLTGALGGRTVDPWGPATVASLGGGVHAVPSASSVLVARLARAARVAGADGPAYAACFEPTSESGRAALDELFEQAVALLNFTSMPTAVLGRQIVHDVASPISARAVEARVRRESAELLGAPAPSLVVLRPGVFHGVAVAMRAPVAAARWMQAIRDEGRLEIAEEGDDGASPAIAARTERAVVGRVDDDEAGGAWAFAAADSLAFGAVGGAVEILARSGGFA